MVEITNRKDSVVLFLVEEVMREIWKSWNIGIIKS